MRTMYEYETGYEGGVGCDGDAEARAWVIYSLYSVLCTYSTVRINVISGM